MAQRQRWRASQKHLLVGEAAGNRRAVRLPAGRTSWMLENLEKCPIGVGLSFQPFRRAEPFFDVKVKPLPVLMGAVGAAMIGPGR